MPANIDVARDGNCGFETIAAVLIDSHRHKKFTSAHALGYFSDLIKVYKREFPQDLIDADTTQEAFEQLIANFPPKELIRRLAFTLRQYGVDMIAKEPQKYPGAFVDNTEGTDPATMRKSGKWIDGSVLTAISTGIKIPIVVIGDNFKAQVSTQPSVCKPIELFLSGSHYQPYVEDPSYFSQTHESKYTPKPQAEVQRNDPPLSEILAQIDKAEKLDKEKETQVKIELDNKYSTDQLIGIYRAAMETSDYLPTKILRITDENQGDQFFYNAIQNNKIDASKEKQIREILVHALAKQAYIDPNFDHQKLHQNAQSLGAEFKMPRLGQG